MPKEKADIERLLKKYTIRKGTPQSFRPLHEDVLIRLLPKGHRSDVIVFENRFYDEFQVGAEVIAVGDEQKDVKPGDKVIAEHNVLNGDLLVWEDDETGGVYELIGPKAVLAVVEAGE